MALAASRPRYGGTLHVLREDAPEMLDPAAIGRPSSSALSQDLSQLVFENLVQLDERGQSRPGLALSWQAEPGMERWHFVLRPGVHFTDGSPLDPVTVASSLRTSNPTWKILSDQDAIVIEAARAEPELPAELALARHAIVRRAEGRAAGTGPFSIERWEAKKQLVLVANEDYWGGRPYLDRIDIRFGENTQHELTAFDLSQAELIEIDAQNIRRLESEGRNIRASEPAELVALVFRDEPRSEADVFRRNRLAAAIDRPTLTNVLLQAGGEPAGAVLPTWLSGYGFLFQTANSRATERGPAAPATGRLTLSNPEFDPVMRLLAERILLDARQAAVEIELTASEHAEARLVRIELPSLSPGVALGELARSLELPQPEYADLSPSSLYAAEQGLLATHRLIPLVYLRRAVALGRNLEGWHKLPDGHWQLADVWLAAGRP